MSRGMFRGMSGGVAVSAATTPHVVEIQADGATILTVGAPTDGKYVGQTFVPGNAGTITSIEVYTSDMVAGNVLTMRWKHRTGAADYDLSSYIDSIGVTPANGGYTMYNVTDTVVAADDLYLVGFALTTGTAGDCHVTRNNTGTYASGQIVLPWDANIGAWNLADNESLPNADMRVRFTIYY